MKIAILYICTGNYQIFWRPFYQSCEKNFLPGHQKNYYVFTDKPKIYGEGDNPNIQRYYWAHKPWPHGALFRFHKFIEIENELLEHNDYCLFFNSNSIIRKRIEPIDILPRKAKDSSWKENLVAQDHCYSKPRELFTYETNPNSTAYVPYNEGKFYFQSGLCGGRTREFLDAAHVMSQNIDEDLKKGIIAVFDDESHWNRYLVNRDDVRVLPVGFTTPFGPDSPICLLDKERFLPQADLNKNIKSMSRL